VERSPCKSRFSGRKSAPWGTHAGALLEMQPMGRTHIREVHEDLPPERDPMFEQRKSMKRKERIR